MMQLGTESDQRVEGGASWTYVYNGGNQLKEVWEASTLKYTYVYDRNGNRIEKRQGSSSGTLLQQISYDQRNRPFSVGTATYDYDPSGYRVMRRDSTGRNRYLLEGEHIESVEHSANLSQDPFVLRTKYLRGVNVDEVIGAYEYDASQRETSLSFHHDHLNSVVGVTGHDGATLATFKYDPFGNLQSPPTGSTQVQLRYTGREQDPDTGLYYYRARYYDPEVGRFLTEDPLRFQAGVNFYAYVGNNPVNANDPSGEIVPALLALSSANGVVGGTVSGLANAGIQVVSNRGFDNFNSTNVKIAAGVGFAAGAVGPLTALTTGGVVATNAAANLVQYGVTQYANSKPISVFEALVSTGAGAVAGKLAGTLRLPSTEFVEDATYIPAALAQSLNYPLSSLTRDAALARNALGAVVGAIDYTPLFDYFAVWGADGQPTSGGFVLYPNKANTNALQSVYRKQR